MNRIWCPKCNWTPRPSDLWTCEPGCGHDWHTFDTRGQCPKCLKQWKQTVCFRCVQWSAHERWYHDDGSDQRLNALLEEVGVEERDKVES